MEKIVYPGILERVKAMVADSIVIILMIFLITYFFSYFNYVSDTVRMWSLIFVFGLYEPLFISLFGGSIGHFVLGLRVKRESNPDKKVIFPFTLLRYGIKLTLGLVSFLTITGNEKKKAIHDMAAGSIVIYSK